MVLTKQQQEDIKILTKGIISECFCDDVFLSSLSTKVAAIVTKKLSMEFEKFDDRIKNLESCVDKLRGETESMSNKNKEMTIKISELETKINNTNNHNTLNDSPIASKLISLEQSNKLLQLRILGVEEKSNENTKAIVMNIFEQKLHLNLEVGYCSRLGTKEKIGQKSRPILVHFINLDDRNKVFYSKKHLKGSKIIILEEMVKSRVEIYKLARQIFGNNNTWTKEGRIYLKVNGKKLCVQSKEEIDKLSENLRGAPS